MKQSMGSSSWAAWLAGVGACVCFSASGGASVVVGDGAGGVSGLGDVTDRLVNLGNLVATQGRGPRNASQPDFRPLSGRARNVWDLQSHQGKVYLGGGNTTTNPGPINLWAFDHAAGAFGDAPERVIQSEAIENFRIFNGELVVPNHDPVSGDGLKFDRLGSDGVWRSFGGSPNLAHVRDMARLDDGTLVLVGNSRRPDPALDFDENGALVVTQVGQPGAAVSLDNGQTFTSAVDTVRTAADLIDAVNNATGSGGIGPLEAFSNWFFSAFTYQDRVFATTIRLNAFPDSPATPDFAPGVLEYDQATGEFVAGINGDDASSGLGLFDSQLVNLSSGAFPELQTTVFDPDTGQDVPVNLGTQVALTVRTSVEYNDVLVYAVNTHSPFFDTRRDYYRNSFDFYVKASLEADPVSVRFADLDARGEDVIEFDGVLYALANARQDDGSYVVYVYETIDPVDPDGWDEVLRFVSDNLARSFERIDNTFYFGLGYDEVAGDEIGDAGALLAVLIPEPGSAAVLLPALVWLAMRRTPTRRSSAAE
ncbi:MAG: hypothetical protein AAGE65_08390 [Planctomycetota bacterium]